MRITHIVRHSNGNSWAVDKWEHFGNFKVKVRTWYFPFEQEARDFKRRRTEEP